MEIEKENLANLQRKKVLGSILMGIGTIIGGLTLISLPGILLLGTFLEGAMGLLIAITLILIIVAVTLFRWGSHLIKK